MLSYWYASGLGSRVGRGVVSLLIEVGVGREHPRPGGDHVGLDAAVVGRPAAAESRHLLGVAGTRIRAERRRREVSRPARCRK